jgi:hypothetical protein
MQSSNEGKQQKRGTGHPVFEILVNKSAIRNRHEIFTLLWRVRLFSAAKAPLMLYLMKFNLDLLKNLQLGAEHGSEVLDKMKRLYPSATEQELRDGLVTLESYLRLALRIAVRHVRERDLTIPGEISTMNSQRSNPTQNINH